MHPLISVFTRHGFLTLIVAVVAGALPNSRAVASNATSESVHSTVDESIVEFLKKSACTRMAAIEAGRMAQEYASEADVKTYAKGMVSEESLLLERLQALAGKLNVTLPESLNEKTAEKLGRLQVKSPDDFERAFWHFLTEIYERDLINFDFASTLENLEVRQFAVQYRSMFERQLAEIKNLRKPTA